MKIAHFGSEKTHTFRVARERFLGEELISCSSVDEVFSLLEQGSADIGVVPAENSFEGIISNTYDNLLTYDNVRVHEEISTKIDHYLLCKHDLKKGDIMSIESHPQALAQCKPWIYENVGNHVQMIPSFDTTLGVRESYDRVFNRAFIVSWNVADAYRKDAHVEKIQLSHNNMTKFFTLKKNDNYYAHHNNVLISFHLKNTAGALYRALSGFSAQGLNMTHIESRPSKTTNWEYVFFATVHGNVKNGFFNQALHQLKLSSEKVAILGAYNQWELP